MENIKLNQNQLLTGMQRPATKRDLIKIQKQIDDINKIISEIKADKKEKPVIKVKKDKT